MDLSEKKRKKLPFFVLSNKSGVILLQILQVIGIVFISMYFYLSLLSQVNNIDIAIDQKSRSTFANSQAHSLARLLIEKSLVLCREEGWSDVPGEVHCRWGGETFHDPQIYLSEFGLSEPESNTSLKTFSVKFNSDINININTTISFKLIDWTSDPTIYNLSDFIPKENSISDYDKFVVLVEVSSKGKSLFSQSTKSQNLIRRPHSYIELETINSQVFCPLDCRGDQSESPFPECRGSQLSVGGQIPISVKIKNNGSGPIYKLIVEKSTIMNPELFPVDPVVTEPVNMMGTLEVLMPGDSVEFSDSVECKTPPNMTVATPSTENTCSSCGFSLSSSGLHAVPIMNVRYSLSLSKFTPESYYEDSFLDQYNPLDPSTFVENTSLSLIEPRKHPLDTTIGETGIANNSTISVLVVPPH